MTAPAAPAALAPAAFQIALIATLAPSTTRTQERRRRRFPKEKLAELAASVRQIGVMQPIVVRPHPKPVAPVKYEIVAGEHRWLAAGIAGLGGVNVALRQIAQAHHGEFQRTQNLQQQHIQSHQETEGERELET